MLRTMIVAVAIAAAALTTTARADDRPSKEACEQVFKKEKTAMNACVEKKCRGKDQQGFQECQSGCALDRSEKYQACFAKYVLGW